MAESDSSSPCIIGFGSSPSRCGPLDSRAAKVEVSRFPFEELTHMPGSSTTRDRSCARVDAHPRFAFRCDNGVGVPIDSFAAQWLAYAHPYRRFAPGLAADDARLGADVVRYSFIVVDLHLLLLAGLPAHCHRNARVMPGIRTRRDARLGAGGVRSSFTAGNRRRRLRAGLPAHCRRVRNTGSPTRRAGPSGGRHERRCRHDRSRLYDR